MREIRSTETGRKSELDGAAQYARGCFAPIQELWEEVVPSPPEARRGGSCRCAWGPWGQTQRHEWAACTPRLSGCRQAPGCGTDCASKTCLLVSGSGLGVTWKLFASCRGEVINGGFGLVLDGTEEAEQKARMMLSWDVSNGVSAHQPPPHQWLCFLGLEPQGSPA